MAWLLVLAQVASIVLLPHAAMSLVPAPRMCWFGQGIPWFGKKAAPAVAIIDGAAVLRSEIGAEGVFSDHRVKGHERYGGFGSLSPIPVARGMGR